MSTLINLLEAVRAGDIGVDEARAKIGLSLLRDLGHTTLDLDRARRVGAAEVVYAEHKEPRQVAETVEALVGEGQDALVTRASVEQFEAVQRVAGDAEFHGIARLITVRRQQLPRVETSIAVVTAGTSDLPIAEEAALTAEFYGNPVLRIRDVGVAGIHRMLARIDDIRSSRIAVVVAGMEGALPSVVGGLIEQPVIAVPTSVGYGASFGGIAALLGMLNSCASGVCVVNIDNGFGAGYLASMINRL